MPFQLIFGVIFGSDLGLGVDLFCATLKAADFCAFNPLICAGVSELEVLLDAMLYILLNFI